MGGLREMEDKIQLCKDEIIMRFVTSKKYKKHGYTERLKYMRMLENGYSMT